MSEEQKEQPQQNQGGSPENNGASTPDELELIKAELDEERKATAAAQSALAEKDTLIANLQAQLTEAKKASEVLTADKASLSNALSTAVGKYLDVVKAANPTIPGDVLTGATIADIDASVAKALSIATAVRASLEAQAKETKVPAGAPARGAIALESMTPREKITAGLQQTRS